MAGDVDLTGRWTGVYFYPTDSRYNANDNLPATPFEADLTDVDGRITGATLEDDLVRRTGRKIAGVLEGVRTADELTFTKYPDNSHHLIRYTGAISSDGNSISGAWTIPNDWSGTFRMQRKVAPVGASLETLTSIRQP